MVLVAMGGALGTALRELVNVAVSPSALATVIVNLTGSFALGLLTEVLSLRGADTGRRRDVRLAVGTGVLGGYTTYSAFAVGTVDGVMTSAGTALAGAVGQVLLGAATAGLGVLAGRAAPGRR